MSDILKFVHSHALVLVCGGLVTAASSTAFQTSTSLGEQPLPMTCPAQLGTGVKTGRGFCDVLITSEAAGGVLIQLPKRTRAAMLSFDLHTRHTYSAEQERAGTAFVRQTATVAVLALDRVREGSGESAVPSAKAAGKLLTRAVVQAEFRNASDLFDRITGGAGPSGLKAVAPVGVETISLEVPASIGTVSLVGEQLIVTTVGGEEVYTTTGRPVAVVSRPVLEMARPTTPPRRAPRKG